MMHKHWFHLLWSHFGPYGDQAVHWHPCEGDADVINEALDQGYIVETDSCDWALIGVGRDCGGKLTRHWTQSLSDRVEARSSWDSEGQASGLDDDRGSGKPKPNTPPISAIRYRRRSWSLFLNPDKSYVLEWLRNAKTDLARANEAMDRAIALAEQTHQT